MVGLDIGIGIDIGVDVDMDMESNIAFLLLGFLFVRIGERGGEEKRRRAICYSGVHL